MRALIASQMDMQRVDTDLYRDIVRAHGRAPCCAGALDGATARFEAYNTLCGDRVVVTLHLDGEGRICAVRHATDGCLLCVASASMMALHVVGLGPAEMRTLHQQLAARINGAPGFGAEARYRPVSELPADLDGLTGVAAFPSRRQCVLLPWRALESALGEDAACSQPAIAA
jgi:nitrogen fixation NifU-like protein